MIIRKKYVLWKFRQQIKTKSLQTQMSQDNTKIPYFLQIHEKHLNPQKGQRGPFKA